MKRTETGLVLTQPDAVVNMIGAAKRRVVQGGVLGFERGVFGEQATMFRVQLVHNPTVPPPQRQLADAR